MVGYRRPGKVGLFGDFTNPKAPAVAHFQHFQNQMLPCLIANGSEDFGAGCEIVCQKGVLLLKIHDHSSFLFKRLNQGRYITLSRHLHIRKEK